MRVPGMASPKRRHLSLDLQGRKASLPRGQGAWEERVTVEVRKGQVLRRAL